MVPQTQITEVKAELVYVVAHQAGPTYTGPSSGQSFVNGLLDHPVAGSALLFNSMANITHFWEAKPGHRLEWRGDVVNGEWLYVPVKAAPKKAAKKATKKSRKKKAGK